MIKIDPPKQITTWKWFNPKTHKPSNSRIVLIIIKNRDHLQNKRLCGFYLNKVWYLDDNHPVNINGEKARLKLAKAYEKITNQKLDFTHKLTTQLVKNHDVIVCEGLAVASMMKNKYLARSIGDVSWGEIIRQLEYKCAWNDRQFAKIDRYFPSSQLCSNCGFINQSLTLKNRTWECPKCSTEHDRDANAALNILKQGLTILGCGTQSIKKRMEASPRGEPMKCEVSNSSFGYSPINL